MNSFFVHVVESPSSADLLDGRTEGRVLLESLQISGIQATYNLITDEPTLNEAFGTRLVQAIDHHDRFPIVHLSLHGNNNGLALTNGHFVDWHRLRQYLLPLNNAMNGGLIVSMSACFGISGCIMAMHENEPLPFFALVGHPDSAMWSDAAVGFSAFYHRLSKGASLPDAVVAMKAASGDDRFDLRLGTDVQQFFISFMANYRVEQVRSGLTKSLAQTT
ncbi:hypothetical protein V7x_54230 [Crateriforma conspicua]|uniref:Peptidase C13 family protein n=1 Tax=Crateriforma conspicua TaxID=2527996 RepID=A0A5C6FH99_9PLAN|nr:hypothetical protein [Crateriforma conspicua]TWU61111.1 hypothetical protein V7x_54230 [Crateriforma conspicua]